MTTAKPFEQSDWRFINCDNKIYRYNLPVEKRVERVYLKTVLPEELPTFTPWWLGYNVFSCSREEYRIIRKRKKEIAKTLKEKEWTDEEKEVQKKADLEWRNRNKTIKS